MTIYVVTKGSYSDYHIVAATLDKEKAEKIAKRFSDKWDECNVEEYEDCVVDLRPYWDVRFEETTGKVVRCTKDNYCEYCVNQESNISLDYHGNLYVTIAADTQEEAIKIASEKRAEYLAQKEGIC